MPLRRKFKVRWTATAERDLLGIVDYIADENVETAFTILKRIRTKAANLYTSPHRGRVVPELADHGVRIYRELTAGPWRILYRVSDQEVFVVAVIDSRRNVEDLLLERFVREP